MRKPLLFLLIVLTMPLIINAQDKKDRAVANVTEQLRLAMINPDKNQLEKLVAENLSYGHSSGAVDDKTTFVDKLVSGQSDFVNIDILEQSITITGKTAIVRHILEATTNDNGKPGEVKLRVLLVWLQQGGKWKLLARQAVKM